MKTSRERILNARIDSIVGSTDYRVPEGYYHEKTMSLSDQQGILYSTLWTTVHYTTTLRFRKYEALN